ncbi:MAG: hypothetical protein PUC33_04965 [Oscillospiraceae bacterium]|nr:hypothetical protein [Oscillospiraceae bacterium]MDD6146307.1 hypothetical protein [Oscillospiraceae bacterium]
MNKTIKKSVSLVLALIMLLSMGLSAMALNVIPADEAKTIAIEDSRLTADEIESAIPYLDSNQYLYTVVIIAHFSDNSYAKYTYEIKAADGTIFTKSAIMNYNPLIPSNPNGVQMTANSAAEIAYKAFRYNASEVTLLSAELKGDLYSITFAKGTEEKNSCLVNSYTGEITGMETIDCTKSPVDRVILILQIVITMIKNVIGNFTSIIG